jgi:hypothetical protein
MTTRRAHVAGHRFLSSRDRLGGGIALARNDPATAWQPRRERRTTRDRSSSCSPGSDRQLSPVLAILYDHFTPFTLIQLEELGFCGRGEAKDYIADGAIEIGGRLPINTHGGQLGEAYIHGMNGVAEGVRQLRGTSVNQVPDVEHVLVTAGTGVPTSGLILAKPFGASLPARKFHFSESDMLCSRAPIGIAKIARPCVCSRTCGTGVRERSSKVGPTSAVTGHRFHRNGPVYQI